VECRISKAEQKIMDTCPNRVDPRHSLLLIKPLSDAMYRFLIVIERSDGNYSAYSPHSPGCVARGATREEAEQNMYQAIEIHTGLRRTGSA
jgi:predicted RNase H-like HicB family nuclease